MLVMATLNWMGKDKVVNHHREVPFRVLNRIPENSVLDSHGSDCGNMIIHGDNLEALKALLPQYEGRIDVIYIDPPYNTGNENWIYNDNVNDPRIKKWIGEVVGPEGQDFSRHDKWLCMMYPRLQLLRKLLAPTGVIFISIDDNEHANLKLICDEIFGTSNHFGTICWKSRTKPSNVGSAKVKPQRDAEYVVCYSKTLDPNFEQVLSGNKRTYPHRDKDGSYRLQTILKSNRGESARETMRFSLNGYTPPPSKRWQAGEDKIKELWQNNRITFQTGEPMLKYYEHEENAENSPFWCFVSSTYSSTAENGKKTLNSILGIDHGFDTVKPVELIDYLLAHSCKKNDSIILDSFAGSGTTAQAVLEANKKDAGNRKFILVELSDYTDSITAERVRRVIRGYGKGKNTVEGLDSGFSYYELGVPFFLDDNSLNPQAPLEKLKEYIWYTETKVPYEKPRSEHPYYLGEHLGTVYYFMYKQDTITTLSSSTLSTLPIRGESTVIYADRCVISSELLNELKITFKQIPRKIARF